MKQMNSLHKKKNNEPFMLLELGINENGYEFALILRRHYLLLKENLM